MPQDIVLRDLTTPPVKGSISPLISTVPAERDGTRGGTVPPSTPSDDLRFADSPYAPLTPGGDGNGTIDPLFTFDKFEYLGCFVIGGDSEAHRSLRNICFAPPSGSNGASGSLFATYQNAGPFDNTISEYKIPDSYGLGFEDSTWTQAETLQSNFEIYTEWDNPDGRTLLCWPKIVNGKMFLYHTIYYGTTPATANVYVVDDPHNLATSTYNLVYLNQGAYKQDYVASYCFEIPESRRAEFDNHSHIAGCFNEAAVVAKFGFGPSLFGWNPENYTIGDSEMNSTEYANWIGTTQFFKYNKYNDPVIDYFFEKTGIIYESYLYVPPTATTGVPLSSYDSNVIDEPLVIGSDGTMCLSYRGVYEGTVVVKSADGNTTYTDGVNYDLLTNVGSTTPRWGLADADVKGRHYVKIISGGGISVGDTVLVSYRRLTRRYPDFTYFEQPSQTLSQDGGGYFAHAKGGVFVPNTDTILLLGNMGGARFGMGYKVATFQEYPAAGAGGGPTPVDNRDLDDYFWLFNVNDVLAATSPDTVPIQKYGIFDNNLYRQAYAESSDSPGKLQGCAYDSANKKLYVFYTRMTVPGKTNDLSAVVRVYKLNF